ncbi:MAG TPA: lysylphosphatidylglycerol synthase transmembrane domain-containing protein [Steroidobacteraceae bacterium]|nr:lysylphosphatidylglycerol synthase transmembrane domain-containing protein [Steroidobacteraceae bacterium]
MTPEIGRPEPDSSERAQASNSARKRRALVVVAAVGVAVYVVVALMTDASGLMRALRRLGWLGVSAIFGLSLLNYAIRFTRWHSYIRRLGHRLPVRELLLCYLGGFAFTVSPGKAGEAVRSLYLREHGVTYSESVATLFIERLLDLLSMIVLAALVVLVSPGYSWLLIGMATISIVGMIVIGRPELPAWLARRAEQRQGHRTANWYSAASSTLVASRTLLHPRLLLSGLGLGVMSWGAEGLGFFLVCNGLAFTVGAAQAVGIYAVASLAGVAAILLPAGIGGTEAVMTTLLVSRGAPLADALIATLLCRLATLWFAVVIGLIAMAQLELRQKQALPAPAN